MATAELKSRVDAVIRTEFPDFAGEITDQTIAADVPGWDSVAHVTLMLQLELALGIQLDADETFQLANVGDLYALVARSS